MNGDLLVTPYGAFAGVSSRQWYESGELGGLTLAERNAVVTHVGELIPLYDPDGMRRKTKRSVTFYKTGMIRSVSLQEQQEISTPIGEFPAELVIFYDTGELSRFFVTDGQLSGFWTLKDERAYNVELAFDLGFTIFRAMLTGIAFYKSGAMRSLTLFPDETIDVTLPNGFPLRARIGFSFFESGALESVEPAKPTAIKTPIGTIEAYDSAAIGVHADRNSLRFDEAGRLRAITTATTRLSVFPKSGAFALLSPQVVPSALDPERTEITPLTLEFDYESGTFAADIGQKHAFRMDDTVVASRFDMQAEGCSPEACANCKLCSHD